MRLGELHKKVQSVVNDSQLIVIDATAILSNQVYEIGNYDELYETLSLLANQEWNEFDFDPIESIFSENEYAQQHYLTTADYNAVNSYVGQVNQKLPTFMGIISTLYDEQDEHAVNIKLPVGVESIEELTKFNDRLIKIFKKFNINGGIFKFVGIDKGSKWYEVLITDPTLFAYFMAANASAIAFLKTQKSYFEKETARFNYEAAKESNNKLSQKKYAELVATKQLESSITEAVEKIGNLNGNTEASMHSMLVSATKDLVKELDEGTEFHLSLNAPEYLEEKGGKLKIDYSSIPKLEKSKKTKKELTEGSKTDEKAS